MTSVRELFDLLPIAVAIRHLEGETTRWSYVNVAMCKLLGHESAETLRAGGSFDVIADERERRAAMQRRRALLRGERIGFHVVRWRKHDGSVIPVEITVALIDFEGERSVMVVGRDLRERTDLRERLAIAERMASLGTLAAGVAHEINSPLTYVLIGLELASKELRALGDDARLKPIVDGLEDVRRGAERIRAIAQSLRSMSRTDDDETTVDLEAVLELAIEVVKHQIQHRARLIVEIDQVPPVRANAGRLGQVFVNLLANAAQSIPVGRADDNEIAIVATSENQNAIVEVRDTGSGIAPEILPRIFDPFFTTKDASEGTGLGLAICHGIITNLGGTITVAASAPRGTVFRVTLPASTATAEPAAPPVESVHATAPAVAMLGRVLVIDDDPTLAHVCEAALSSRFDVVTVHSVHHALTHIRNGEDFDAIVCDLMMPVQTGMDFHAELARTHPRLRDRIIFMTGGTFTTNAKAFLDSVPNVRIDKPFDVDTLVGTVTRVVTA